jgi:hypothetical protein
MDLTDLPPELPQEASDSEFRAWLEAPEQASAPVMTSAAHKAIFLMARHGLAGCFQDGFAIAWRPGRPDERVRVDTFETDGCPMRALHLALRDLLTSRGSGRG